MSWLFSRCINILLSTVKLRAAIKPKYNLVVALKRKKEKKKHMCVHVLGEAVQLDSSRPTRQTTTMATFSE